MSEWKPIYTVLIDSAELRGRLEVVNDYHPDIIDGRITELISKIHEGLQTLVEKENGS